MQERVQLNTHVERGINQIRAIEEEVASMGANDSELPALQRLISSLMEGELLPEDAIEQAEEIRDRKANDH